jgi:DNA-directed RNA polymerase specialized sigma24 family protein
MCNEFEQMLHEDVLDVSTGESPADPSEPCMSHIDGHELEPERLAHAIGQLSPIRQVLIVGYYFEGKGCRELEKEAGIARGSAKRHLYRARKRILKDLQRSWRRNCSE